MATDASNLKEIKRLFHDLEAIIEDAWRLPCRTCMGDKAAGKCKTCGGSGRHLPWSVTHYHRVMTFLFPSIFETPPKQRELWDKRRAEVKADREAMNAEECAVRKHRIVKRK